MKNEKDDDIQHEITYGTIPMGARVKMPQTSAEQIRDLQIALRRALLTIRALTGFTIFPPYGPDAEENEAIKRVMGSFTDKPVAKPIAWE